MKHGIYYFIMGAVISVAVSFATTNFLVKNNGLPPQLLGGASTFPTSSQAWAAGDVITSNFLNNLEHKIGTNQSSDTTSLDYQINTIFTSYNSEQVASSAMRFFGTTSTPTFGGVTLTTATSSFQKNFGGTTSTVGLVLRNASGSCVLLGYSSLNGQLTTSTSACP